MQKLKQLTFDRRSSTILKTWANLHGPAPEPAREALDSELAAFQRNVTLGNWAAVKTYLAGLPEEEGKAAYRQLLQSLQSPPAVPASGSPAPASPTPAVAMAVSAQEGVPVQARPAQVAQQPEPNVFAAEDIVGLAGAAPRSLDKDATAALGAILRQALAGGLAVEQVVVRMKAESARPGGALTKRQAAQLLVTADQAAAAGDFLPGLDQATADKDAEALNLLARHFLALHAKEQKATHLEQAWRATQAALATGAGHRAEQEEALKRAVELAPQIQEALGKTWLEQSFTSRPERGMDILATIGSLAAQGMQTQPMNATERLKTVQLQKTAVEALLRATPARAADWRMTLTLLAGNWLREAELTYQFAPSSNSGPRMQRDPYGNIFYVNDNGSGPMMPPQPNQPAPIPTSDILEARPGEAWLALVDDGLKPHLVTVFARLYLKAGEEEKAFPFIEQLAGSHPEPARELVNEFLRVWTQNHDPNANRGYTNAYMFMYGFERRAESIPLTRSKQERNLEELAGWVRRLRRLPIRDPDEDLLAKAFTSSHSNAEVYRLDAIEKVFGPIGSLKPRTLSGLVQQMRENLAGVWRDPAVQKDKKTNRKTRDIQAEVLRGYDLAQTVTEDALKKFPDDWSLHLARAALHLDEAYYRQELARYPEFSRRRDEAFAEFQQAARLYAARVKGLGEEEQSTKVYEQWFYASLGACDLEHVTEDKLPDLKQPALIRAAILGLPGELAERHLGRFANTLFTRLSAVKPAVKFRYLGGGFEIA
ncbi:MAG: hypothetical protein JO112_01720, partial [Planctomycetes bacterium]|nr:hypothetical protein [Planctomycetota bacterium]